MVAAMTCKLFLIKEVFGLKYAIILERLLIFILVFLA